MLLSPRTNLILAIVILALPSSVLAIDWIGDVDSSWTTNNAGDTNWAGNVIPTGADDVIIDVDLVTGGVLSDFEEGVYRNITIFDGNNSGTPLELNINGSATTTATPGFGAPNGTLLIQSGVGTVTVNQSAAGNYGLNDSNITVEDGVLGDFTILAGSNRQRFRDFHGNSINTSTFTNNSDQTFHVRMRDGDTFELTLHSDVNGTPGEFTLFRSGNGFSINELNLTGDARVDSSSTGSPIFSSEAGTEFTNTGGLSNLSVRAGDTTATGRITGNLNLNIGTGNQAALTATNDDTYIGTTTLGGGTSNTNRAMALIREGSHVGGDDYTIIGGLRNDANRRQNAVLGGSGAIELQGGATMTLARSGAAGFRARATLAPGNTGFDVSGVDSSTGAVGLLTAGNQGIGTLTVTADEVAFGDYGRLEVQVAGPLSDQLAILAGTGGNTNAGNLNLTSTLDELFIDADLLGDANGDDYTLLSWAGTRTGEFDAVWLQDGGTLTDLTAAGLNDFLIDGFEYDLVYGANSLLLDGPNSATVIPEPTGIALWLLLGLGLAGYSARRWRQSRN